MDTAKKNLEKAGEDDELSDLQDELEECTLVAETSGTVTALNATVGSVCDGTVATIQDTEDLVVAITISEDDVKNVELGMDCKITTDATEDVIQGTLTQVNPTAGENGTFEAQVQVENGSNRLLVGMNASVEIIQSVTENVYVVPLDAVDEDENGSFVFQTYNLIGRQSALKNVELPMLYAGVPPRQRTRRAHELLAMVEMDDRCLHQPNELSGGQKQRVAIARAMANNPDVLLADEPTGALDSQTSRTVMDIFHRLHRQCGKTIVLITHNQELAEECQRILTLRDGLIVGERAGKERAAHAG